MSRPARLALRLAAAVAVAAGALSAAPATGQVGSFEGDTRAEVLERGPNGKWRECPSVQTDSRPLKGGCVLESKAKTLFTILTPFGRTRLSECDFRFTAHVQPNGEVALDDVATSGGEVGNVCGDVRACRLDTDVERQPWLGRIVPAGDGYKLVLDACMDTCAGWFEGPLELSLDRVDGALRARGERAQLGESGLELTGAWKLEGDDVKLKEIPNP